MRCLPAKSWGATVFHYEIFVLTCLMMFQVQAETCSTRVKATILIEQACIVFDRISAVYLVLNRTGWLP